MQLSDSNSNLKLFDLKVEQLQLQGFIRLITFIYICVRGKIKTLIDEAALGHLYYIQCLGTFKILRTHHGCLQHGPVLKRIRGNGGPSHFVSIMQDHKSFNTV